MSRDKQNFHEVVDFIMRRNRDFGPVRQAVEKELLHYDILHAMHDGGYTKGLVFQGGTCLRMIHGSRRLSEDLDFAGGRNFTAAAMDGISEAVSFHLGSKYGMAANVRSPKRIGSAGRVNVSAWQVSVETSPARRDMPRQRIKIDIANVVARTVNPGVVRVNHKIVPPSFGGMVIPAESPEEIMADKIVSLSSVDTHVRYRDIWDIGFICNNLGISQPNVKMVAAKVMDYGIHDFRDRIDSRIRSIPEIVNGERFNLEMKRFVPPLMSESTLQDRNFRHSLTDAVSGILTIARDGMFDRSSGRTH